jgi:hypothetical protein
MTKDEIIEMLAKVYGVAWTSKAQLRDLTAFANLVAQHEREACAVIAETAISGEQDDITMEAKDRVAKAIRARGEA